jgi:hypothetical protein
MLPDHQIKVGRSGSPPETSDCSSCDGRSCDWHRCLLSKDQVTESANEVELNLVFSDARVNRCALAYTGADALLRLVPE